MSVLGPGKFLTKTNFKSGSQQDYYNITDLPLFQTVDVGNFPAGKLLPSQGFIPQWKQVVQNTKDMVLAQENVEATLYFDARVSNENDPSPEDSILSSKVLLLGVEALCNTTMLAAQTQVNATLRIRDILLNGEGKELHTDAQSQLVDHMLCYFSLRR